VVSKVPEQASTSFGEIFDFFIERDDGLLHKDIILTTNAVSASRQLGSLTASLLLTSCGEGF
jgi:hypothetical protein